MFRFVVDRTVRGQAYPNLAWFPAEPYTQSWREFGSHAPYTVPVELITHCEQHGYPYSITTTADYLAGHSEQPHWYPVQFARFDQSIQYVGHLPARIRQALAAPKRNIKILFYYHEGDRPAVITESLDGQFRACGLTPDCYRLVTGNTAAERLQQGNYFADHELLYYTRNKEIPAKQPEFLKTGVPMRQSFLLLSRLHKWWRATVVTDLQRQGLLSSAVWSYNTAIPAGDHITDCPIDLDLLDIRSDIDVFLAAGPYRCDDLTADQHNDHSVHVQEHYDRTACSIVLETLFDADGSPGTFLTEKTFKCLKHGHPFVLFAPAGSLALLRSMGYRTFDSVIPNRYDTLTNHTQRYLSAVRTVQQLSLVEPNQLYNACVEDLIHNQQVFLASKRNRLNTLYERLHNE